MTLSILNQEMEGMFLMESDYTDLQHGLHYRTRGFTNLFESVNATRLWDFYNTRNRQDIVMWSWDDKYVPATITDSKYVGRRHLIRITDERGRQTRILPETTVMTTDGFIAVNDLRAHHRLALLDYYHRWYSDKDLRFDATPGGAIPALLRNHGVDFERFPGYTFAGGKEFWFVNYDTDGPSDHDNVVTLGRNNYRQYLSEFFNLPPYHTSKIAKIQKESVLTHTVTFWINPPSNFITSTGYVLGFPSEH
jgi:hypothetical protein